MEILLLLALVLLNGVFAMTEIALITSKRAKLQKDAEAGDSSAQLALTPGEDPNRFLSTIQVGITSIGVMSGIVGEAALARPPADSLETIVLGELVPKRLGQSNPELVARLMAKPIAGLSILTRPFVRLLSVSTAFVLKLLGVAERTQPEVTAEEIQAVLAEGTEAGLIESQEHAMLKNVFRLDDRQIASLMVPRADIVYFDQATPLAESLHLIESSDHARYPLVKGGLDNVVGVVNARKLLSKIAGGAAPDLTLGLEETLYVPDTLTGMELLNNFRTSGRQLAFVVDEYGEALGLVTLKDLIEAITGEFKPRDPTQSWGVQRDDGTWLLDGHIPIPELKDRLRFASVPDEEKGRCPRRQRANDRQWAGHHYGVRSA
jgi:putative hemolysin